MGALIRTIPQGAKEMHPRRDGAGLSSRRFLRAAAKRLIPSALRAGAPAPHVLKCLCNNSQERGRSLQRDATPGRRGKAAQALAKPRPERSICRGLIANTLARPR
jgi:hypothetical protein